jgi:mono/diheme cytochrome c family protein
LTALWAGSGALAGDGDAAKGKASYDSLCVSCHGATGKGDGAAAAALNPKPKDLSDKAYMGKLDDKYLSDIIAKGGTAVGKSAMMPPWGGSLKEEDIRNVIAHLRSLAK